MNLLDKTIAAFSPGWAVERSRARKLLNVMNGYEAARPNRNRKTGHSHGNGDRSAAPAHRSLRGQARWLEENHDLARAVIDELVKKCLGRSGIGFEPMPQTLTGELHQDFQRQILRFLEDWYRRPEVSHSLNWSQLQRLAFRCWIRDGEFLAKKHTGNIATLDHGTVIPFSLELLEADFLPESLLFGRVTQGVERNSWGQVTTYHLYERHPGAMDGSAGGKTRAVPAHRVIHSKLINRFNQARGISLFSAVFTRLEDIKDIEEAERVAARISAAMAFYIKKGTPDMFEEGATNSGERNFELAPGMGFDDLLPGEDVGTIQSNRPNVNVVPFVDANVRRVAGGTMNSYSSISRNYNGTYSAQRQELVEGYEGFAILADEFIAQFLEPSIEAAIHAGIAAGLLVPPPDVDPLTITRGDYMMPPMPWIKPTEEIEAIQDEVDAGLASRAMKLRERGKNPDKVRQSIKREKEKDKEDGLSFTSNKSVMPQEKPIDENE
jgi:lambda family phage portal protein